jgi:hypothetical protein
MRHGLATQTRSKYNRLDSVLMLTKLKREDTGLPFHPTCFEIFKRISMDRLGQVDASGLWSYWREVSPFPTVFRVLRMLTRALAPDRWKL